MRTLAAACALTAVGAVCIDPLGVLCLDWVISGPTITFNATCAPTPGSHTIFWCGFGLSHAASAQMFPAEAIVINVDPATQLGFIEDRDSAVGYSLPPCFPTQLSTLLSVSSSGGVLRATWRRPLVVNASLAAEGYISLSTAGPTTVLGASSADTAVATVPCAGFMQVHSYVQPGVSLRL
jgi:hypothetical protein